MVGIWPCANPDCGQPCTSLALDRNGLCPSCSFNRTLDDIAAKRALRRPDLWDEEEDEPAMPPTPEPFPLLDTLAMIGIAFLLVVLLLAFFYILPAFGVPRP